MPPAEEQTAAGDEKIIAASELDAHAGTSSVSAGSEEQDGTSTKQEEKDKQLKPKWYRRLNPIRLQKIPPVPSERGVSPEYGANFFSLLSFQWMAPLMHVSTQLLVSIAFSFLTCMFKTGYLRPLQHEDIWTVNPNRSVIPLKDKLNKSFEARLQKGGKYPLLWALYDTFKFEFWVGGVCQFFSSLLMVFSPYMTRYLIAYATTAYAAKANHQPEPSVSSGIGYAIGITCMQIVQSLCTNQFIYRGFMVGGQMRAVLVNMLFDKTLKISSRARAGGIAIENAQSQENKGTGKAHNSPKGGVDNNQGWSNGRIITLMSVDADRINTASGMFHMIWTSPIAIIVTLILLCINIGYSALAGFALLVIGVPAVTMAVKSLFKRRVAINKLTDQRVSLTQEILQSVRFVKFFGWEGSFLERLKDIRKREIVALQVLLAIRNAVLCVSMSIPTFASVLSFITYSLSQHVLTPAPIFSSLALFNSLRMPLNLLPQVLGQVTDAWTALMRIQEFLLAEEIKDEIRWDENMSDAIKLENATFTWERNTANEKDPKKSKAKGAKQEIESSANTPDTGSVPFQVKDLSFSIKRNELVAVIGTVGSGKTSLLAALAGDMRLTDGSIDLGASRAYCPQYAWIQNATVKNNILFGKDFDEKWYNKVVDACALRPDFDVFPAADSTEIGERGITVSGGQKQRLNIARAIYFDADIILMDDPLSAVDAHVGRHIMEQAICGLLKDKCRILATHQLHVLNRCDRIILMDDGHVSAVDTFDNLMRDNQLFQKLMSTTTQESEHQDKKESAAEGDEEVGDVTDTPKKAKPGKQVALMQQEERATSSVSWGVWKAYIQSTGSIFYVIVVVVMILLVNASNIVTSLWLSYWTSEKYPFSTGEYIAGYASLAASQSIFVFIYSTVLTNAGTNASKTMLQRAMSRVLRAPMSFFDTTPLGRVTNRFSKDIHTMDNDLCDAMRIYALTITMIVSIIVLIIVYFHYVSYPSCILREKKEERKNLTDMFSF
jgi:ABC-type multidrug transport system fused ATPase/permease subunit